MDVYGVVSLLQMRMMNKSNESMGYWICNHIYITWCVHVSNDVQINVRVWEQKMRVFVVDVSDWWAQPIAVYKHEHDSLKNDVLLMP